jgi:hypothetical protein
MKHAGEVIPPRILDPDCNIDFQGIEAYSFGE